jgi:hypothetical protein
VKKYLLVTASTLVLNAAAFAANVVPIEGPLVIPMDGSLMVNSGNGFQQVAGPSQVAPGGSVMVSPGGKGEIVYTDGCRVPVRSGALAQVDPVSPCAQGADFGVAPAAYGASPCCQDSSWLGYTALGVVGVAGIVAAAWGGNHHDNQNGPVIVLSNKIDPITVTGTNTNSATGGNATGGNATASNANANTAVAIAAQAQNQDQAQQQQQQQNQCQGQVGTANNTGTNSRTALCAVSP